MAVYASQADVEAAIGAGTLLMIADHDNDGVVDADVVSRALSEASSLADGYLLPHLPLSTVPDVLRRCVVDIAAEHMRADDQSTEDSRRRYKAALDWLRDVAKGLVTFVPEVPLPTPVPGSPELVTQERAWTRQTSRGVF